MPTVAFAAYAAFREHTAVPERNLVADLPALLARLARLVADPVEYAAAARASCAAAAALALPRVVEEHYEPMRARAVERCGCAREQGRV